jgi:hypothetical protein
MWSWLRKTITQKRGIAGLISWRASPMPCTCLFIYKPILCRYEVKVCGTPHIGGLAATDFLSLYE